MQILKKGLPSLMTFTIKTSLIRLMSFRALNQNLKVQTLRSFLSMP